MRIAGGTAKRITKRIINFIFVIWVSYIPVMSIA